MAKRKEFEFDLAEIIAAKAKGRYPNVDSSDFLYPADRAFPISSSQSIVKALHDWGRSQREGTYVAFVKKLYNHVKNKHPEWLSAFPEETLKKAGIKSDSKKSS